MEVSSKPYSVTYGQARYLAAFLGNKSWNRNIKIKTLPPNILRCR
jgi:hypothetical protein